MAKVTLHFPGYSLARGPVDLSEDLDGSTRWSPVAPHSKGEMCMYHNVGTTGHKAGEAGPDNTVANQDGMRPAVTPCLRTSLLSCPLLAKGAMVFVPLDLLWLAVHGVGAEELGLAVHPPTEMAGWWPPFPPTTDWLHTCTLRTESS